MVRMGGGHGDGVCSGARCDSEEEIFGLVLCPRPERLIAERLPGVNVDGVWRRQSGNRVDVDA